MLDTLSALFRKGVGSSPTGVIVLLFLATLDELLNLATPDGVHARMFSHIQSLDSEQAGEPLCYSA